ncbi:MAG: bifunctional folylpolyglutamate synthase/dihydrofolate synthase [Planctomycetaceae bacterium]|nr:bifunctional folylpolyglutamate synthase/dihydrofolate synthase [Planctomycetaceae bacterium]
MEPTAETEYQEALHFLFGRINYERSVNMPYNRSELKLDRMSQLLQLAGNPEQDQKIIHIAGTKGKGSTSHFVSAILTSAGYRTGRFTSPHLFNIEERFAVDGQACSCEDLLDCIRELRPIVEKMDQLAQQKGGHGPTYFEITTAIALLYFQRSQTDFTVLEVGLGGRLDSTNVCNPMVSIITSISFDHTRQLGFTLEAIAGEKAGIIKPGVPVISGVARVEADRVIQQIAQEKAAPLARLGHDFRINYFPAKQLATGNPRIDYFEGQASEPLFSTEIGSLGRHQAANAALAVAAIQHLTNAGAQVELEAIQRALASTQCPARIERVERYPTVILDTAHNVASMDALCDVLSESQSPQPAVLILASTRGKDIRGMLHGLVRTFDHILCTRYVSNPRGIPVDELKRHAHQVAQEESRPIKIHACASPDQAWEEARTLVGDEGLICVTGSFFIAAEIGATHYRTAKTPE